MLLKWVRCAVLDRAGFDHGQRTWAGADGLVDQRGGWDTGVDRVAHVFAFWTDLATCQRFMTGPHDRLAASQADTYSDIEVRLDGG